MLKAWAVPSPFSKTGKCVCCAVASEIGIGFSVCAALCGLARTACGTHERHLLTPAFIASSAAPLQLVSLEDISRGIGEIVGLSADSRQQVDELTDKALAAGANELGEPQGEGFMYMRGFRDLDGHQWSFIHIDLSAIPRG